MLVHSTVDLTPNVVDLNMLVVTGGRERTAEEYGRLLAAADFKMTDVKPTHSPFVVFEAAPT
jgi:hypothetical protein